MRVDDLTGSDLMRLWGVSSWVDPGAEYYLWNGCCIFALINQRGFVDIHMAMDKSKWHQCRMAGKEILQAFGHNKLRAVILEAHSKVINYARRMGFVSDGKGFVILADGTLTPSLIMWREPGEHNERSY
ncbi:hypothetical protein [Atlantibacter hermannii]|uniref:hypothetical protein n=1 Tax=Atlantibacter hermannii TaxID=565 RepID=UPI002FDCB157